MLFKNIYEGNCTEIDYLWRKYWKTYNKFQIILVLKGEKIRKTLFISVQELGSQCEVKNVRTATTVLDSKIFLHFKIEDVFSLSQTRQYIKKRSR